MKSFFKEIFFTTHLNFLQPIQKCQPQKYLSQPPTLNSLQIHTFRRHHLIISLHKSKICEEVRSKMECYQRPNRSDIHLSQEEEATLEAKTRDYFDGVAPKRHTKPQRSDYSTQYVDTFSNTHQSNIPEFVQFQHLENDPQEKKLVYNGSEVTEEFVETEYYKDLNSVDKHHHTTGTGFIEVEKSGKSFHIEPDNDTGCHHSCKCNPATNDWVPASSIEADFNSDKPNRSDN